MSLLHFLIEKFPFDSFFFLVGGQFITIAMKGIFLRFRNG